MWEWWNPEAPWWAKLRRAHKNTAELSQRVDAYAADEPWRVERFPGRTKNEIGFRLRVTKIVPADLLTVVGDVIHNLRSSLDSVAYELAARRAETELTAQQEQATQMPIKATPEEFDDFFESHRLRRALYGELERRALRSAQPFALTEQWEKDPEGIDPSDEMLRDHINRLNVISRIDKHRRLPLVKWHPDLTYWAQPSGGGDLQWAQAWKSHYEDGDILGYLRLEGSDKPPEVEVVHQMHLVLVDDPAYRANLVGVLREWEQYIGGWILPRIFAVANGAEPPLIVGFATGEQSCP